MTRRTYSKAERLSAVFLARQASIAEAATVLGIPVRNVERWHAEVELPADQWEAIEQTLLARASDMSARGETRGLVATLTGAGISARNRRYAELIRQREARQQAEPEPQAPDPFRAITDAMTDEQRALVRDAIDLTLRERQVEDSPVPDSRPEAEEEQALLDWLRAIAALTPEQVAAERATVRAALEAAEAAGLALRPPVLVEPGTPQGVRARLATDVTPESPAPATPTDKERWMVNVTPEEPSAPIPAAPVTVLEAGEHLEDHPTWRRLE